MTYIIFRLLYNLLDLCQASLSKTAKHWDSFFTHYMYLSHTPRQPPPYPPRRPRGTGDDPFGVGDLDSDDEEKKDRKPRRLEGNPSDVFAGDRSKTVSFLAEFKRFCRLNHKADLIRDPFKKSSYFLSLVKGPDVEGWVLQQDDWLDDLLGGKLRLLFKLDEWDVLETEFKKAFIDYAEHERANEQLNKLKMEKGNVDAYIATFKYLAHRGGHNLNEPTVLLMFSRGLPEPLAKQCLSIEDPTSFEEWEHAAQKHHKIWLKVRAWKGDYKATQPSPFQQLSNWWNKGKSRQTPRQFKPRDPDAMDTSAIVRKAVTDAEKQKHCE